MDSTAYLHSINTGNSNSFNVTNSHNTTINVGVAVADDGKITNWLSPLDPWRRHQDVRIERLDGVGNWLLETNEFQEWRRGEGGADKAILLFYGNPGVGKTFLR